jgi:hypothetical protein
MKVARQLVARRTRLIGMRRGQHRLRGSRRTAVFELVEPHVAAPPDDIEIADRHMRRDQEHALIVDGVIHC